MRLVRRVLVLILCGACSGGPAESLYLERLAAILERDVGFHPDTLEPHPTRRFLLLNLDQHKIGPVQFAELHSCDMGGLVGARNSGLGRLAQASQRLGYEARWLCRADGCNLDWIEPVTARKKDRLAAVVWNATLAGPEVAHALTNQIPSSMDSYAFAHAADLVAAVMGGAYCEFSQHTFESMLVRLRNSVPIKARRLVWARYRALLYDASRMLNDGRRPVCLSEKPTHKAERLFAVFRRHFVAGLLPRMSAELRDDRIWLAGLAALHAELGHIAPPDWVDFYGAVFDASSPESEWARTLAAIMDHSKAWQKVMDQCGVDVQALANGG